MSPKLITTYCLLITVLSACSVPTPQISSKTVFYVYRFTPPAFVAFSPDFQPGGETPFSIPPNCSLLDVFPAPSGPLLLIELSCPNGQTVLFLDTQTAAVTQPVSDSDSHFLAWAPGEEAVYLKVDSLGNAHIVLVDAKGRNEF